MPKAHSIVGFVLLTAVACGGRSGLLTMVDGGAVHVTGGLATPGDGGCPPGSGPCGTGAGLRCHDLDTDVMSCGACGRACPAGVACVAGACKRERCTGQRAFRLSASHERKLPGTKDYPYSSYSGADLNRDGRLDLIEYDVANNLVFWLGQRDGSFVASTTYATTGSAPTWALADCAAVGDFDEDGLADLAVTRDEGATVEVRRGLPGGGLGGRAGRPLPRLAMVDLDGDGHLDLVSAASVEGALGRFVAWRGGGDGSFVSSGQYTISDDLIGRYSVQDWDGDGAFDLLARGTSLHVLRGNGDGSFAGEQRCPFGEGTSGAARLDDLDGDGKLDIVWQLWRMQRVATIMGTGSCTLPPRTDYAVPTETRAVALGDLSGDGVADLVVTSATAASLLFVGNGDGSFAAAEELPIQTSAVTLFVTDVNEDGYPDLVAIGDRIEVFSTTCTH